jgi:preprotein translocase subunit SecA
MRSIGDLEDYIKDQARTDVQTSLANDLGEFTGEDPDDASLWDTKGLQSWVMSRFQVNISQAQMRKLNADEVEEMLKEAALEQIDKRDCAGLMKYLEPHYELRELCNWTKEKFNVEVSPEELSESGNTRPAEEIKDLLQTRAKDAYALRELSYPIDQVLAFAFGEGNSTDNPYGADFVRAWAYSKFRVQLPLETIRATPLKKLREELIALQEKLYEDGGLEEEADALIKANMDDAALLKAANERYAGKLTAKDLDGDAAAKREKIIWTGRRFLRRELTELEQFVLIQIFDQSWKDHLYAMDMLKAGIGLQAFAEQDPRIAFKKEGFRYFKEMMMGVRDKVTDLIFRARVGGQPAERRSAYNVTAATHEASTAYGVSENLRQDSAVPVPAGGGEMQQAANQTQGEGAKVKTIVRDTPRVGRNDPCPCGSGKKYKKCHGADTA